ncbi:hypothetical protein P3T76_005790 [Phytophthora citrophthora]|uniref:Uncharacterized protein n=1 Tax=Phytophthora citrophthora TaxID=4793 RepID=A0AAD9GRZ0_9STRA|nr:hypothetical protein P3T76_005790 [Phytophthora citrophthora]
MLHAQVDGGLMTLSPIELPVVHNDGVTARFVANVNTAGNRPMLTNVVQRNRRIYTVITVKLLRTGDVDSEGVALRSYSYLKEFGEWKTLTLPEKRRLATASTGSRQGRFDLVTQDGSVALELEVPTGTDAQTDYYLVKQVAVSIHLQELLQLHFQSLRPIQPLPEPAVRQACVISIAFRSIAGNLVTRCRVPGFIEVERQGDETTVVGASAEQDRPRQRTGIENFEIVTYQADCSSDQNTKVALPNDPGYAWLEVRSKDEEGSAKRSKLYFYAVALHYGTQRVPERGDLRELQFNWLPGVLESFPTLESRRRRCLKGNVRMVTSSNDGKLQELALVAQRLPASRLVRYAARVESYTRHEA